MCAMCSSAATPPRLCWTGQLTEQVLTAGSCTCTAQQATSFSRQATEQQALADAISDGILLRGKECQLEHSARVSLIDHWCHFCIEPCIRLPENSGAQVQSLRLDASLKSHR